MGLAPWARYCLYLLCRLGAEYCCHNRGKIETDSAERNWSKSFHWHNDERPCCAAHLAHKLLNVSQPTSRPYAWLFAVTAEQPARPGRPARGS